MLQHTDTSALIVCCGKTVPWTLVLYGFAGDLPTVRVECDILVLASVWVLDTLSRVAPGFGDRNLKHAAFLIA